MISLESVIGVIAPPNCVECGHEGSALCDNCINSIGPITLICYRCGAVSEVGMCDKCKKLTRLDGVFPASQYEGVSAKLIRQLKYSQNRSASIPIAKIIYDRSPDLRDFIVTNIPTASNRVRMRSFDHTQLIAKKYANLSRNHYQSVLGRIGCSRQVGAPKIIRTKQLKNMFWVTKPYLVKGKKLIIIDDVISTGATIDEVARVLKLAGAKKVVALSFAHKKLS